MLFSFDSPLLDAITARWIVSRAITDHDMRDIERNRYRNPDVRVREECRVLLRAAGAGPGDRGGPIDLLRARKSAAHGVARHGWH